MIFSIIMILLVGVIAYFHYLQGFFSAALSAVFAVMAAAVAIGWHETVVESFLAGRFADQANGMAVCVLFAATYIILRLIFDKFVYGNVRLPPTADKIGGAVMGVIVGVLATGVVSYAAQSMPFGPAVAGYSRLPLADRQGITVPPLPGRQQSRDSAVYDEVTVDSMTSPQSGMFLPTDDWTIGLVSYMSDHSLATVPEPRPLSKYHPDWLLELFGQRIGVPSGARRTALNLKDKREVTVADKIVLMNTVAQRDGELANLRPWKLEPKYTAAGDHALLIVTANLTINAGDNDKIARFSTSGVRLVASGHDYFPIGTMDSTGTLVANKPDDFLFADTSKADAPVHFVFDVYFTDVSVDQKTVRDGVFFEFKRYGREDLTGLSIVPQASFAMADGVIRKPVTGQKTNTIPAPVTPSAVPTGTPTATPPKGRDVMQPP